MSCSRCNASNHVEAGCILNLQVAAAPPATASGTFHPTRLAQLNSAPTAPVQLTTQPAVQPTQAPPAAQGQPGPAPATGGGPNSNGGAPNGSQQNQSPGTWRGRGGFRGKGSGRGQPSRPLTCYNCNQLGHRSLDCRLPRAAKPFHTCFNCNGQGHFHDQCPHNAAQNFLSTQPQPAQPQVDPNQQQQQQQDGRAKPPAICTKCGYVGHRAQECNANW